MGTGHLSARELNELKDYYKHSQGYRERLVAKPQAYFARYVGVVCSLTGPSDLILDLGCGTGNSTKLITSRDRKAVGADISPLFLGSDRSSPRNWPVFAASDAARLPFRDDTFDLVGTMEFIEHVWPVEPVLREMARVLKPTGRMVISSPNLLSPLWPLRDLRSMIFRHRFRPPHYGNFREAASYFLSSTVATIRKFCSSRPNFLPRSPQLALADRGGDYDAAYFAHPRDLMLFLRGSGFSTGYAKGPAPSIAVSVRMQMAALFGGLWGSFILVAEKGP